MQELKEIQSKNDKKIKLELKKENLEEKIEIGKTRINTIEQDFVNYEIELKEDNQKLEELLEIKKPETTKSIPDIISEIKKFQKINDERIKLQSEKNSIHQDIIKLKERFGDRIDSEKETIESALNDLLQEKESLEKFAEEIKEKLEKVNDQKIQKETLKGSLEKEISKFSQLGNSCPTCMQSITDDHHHSLVDDKEKEVKSLVVELQSITNSFFESNTKSKEIQSKIESYEHEISQIQRIIPGIEEFEVKSSRENQLENEIRELEEKFQDSEFKGKDPVEYLTELKDRVMKFDSVTDQMQQIIKAKQKVEKKNCIPSTRSRIDNISNFRKRSRIGTNAKRS